MYNSIIVSGLPGSGKSSLIKSLVCYYRWSVHPIGEMFRKRWGELPDPKLDFEDWWPAIPHEEQLRVNRELAQIVSRGNVIADTRYPRLCAGPNSLKVFLTAPLDVRVQRAYGTKKYEGKTVEQLFALLQKRENDEVNMGMVLFGSDYRRASDYDLVLDTGELSPEKEFADVINLVGPKR